MSQDRVPIRRALISVSDKTGLEELGAALHGYGAEILSTGGTARRLEAAGLPVTEVSDHTGVPEMLDGRVKTLHPKIHGGLLARRDEPEHANAMEVHAIAPIDLLVVALYPFEETLARGAGPEEAIEQIDIGGPAMIRSAAKNHGYVTVITDPGDYRALLDTLAANDGSSTLELRRAMAAKAFSRTAAFDAAIANWFAVELGEALPERLTFTGERALQLRYGENPHQDAALYVDPARPRPGVATATQLQGKALSYNNLSDTDAALELVADLDREKPAAAIIKHANPCGVAHADTLAAAYRKALACDPVSAFGGIVAANRALDSETAQEIAKIFTEVVIAPGVDAEAQAALARKSNLRLLTLQALPDPAQPGLALHQIAGGFLAQTRDTARESAEALRIVTQRAPSAGETADLLFAFTVAKHVKSNAIVYAKDGMTVGIGAGQMNRRDSARIAAIRAQEAAESAGETESLAKGSVVASDAFFPFADGVQAAAEAGATAVIQPGGSKRDDEVIAAADAAGLAMVFTGQRHFRH